MPIRTALRVTGISLSSVGSDLLARLVPGSEESEVLFEQLRQECIASTLVVTCNRVEFWWFGNHVDPASKMRTFLESRGLPVDSDGQIQLEGSEAIRHLIEVTAGLSSQLAGDSDILGQVRAAWRKARDAGHTVSDFDRIFERAVNSARHIRSEAGFDDASRTIGRAAVDAIVQRKGSDLSNSNILVAGSGAAATSAIEAILRHSPGKLSVTSRTFQRALALADKHSIQALDWSARKDAISSSDVVIFAVRSDSYLIDSRYSLGALNGNNVIWVDLGMPPNIDPNFDNPNVELLELGELMSGSPVEHQAWIRAMTALDRETDLVVREIDRRRKIVAAGVGEGRKVWLKSQERSVTEPA